MQQETDSFLTTQGERPCEPSLQLSSGRQAVRAPQNNTTRQSLLVFAITRAADSGALFAFCFLLFTLVRQDAVRDNLRDLDNLLLVRLQRRCPAHQAFAAFVRDGERAAGGAGIRNVPVPDD